jgi:hypothetical protein
VMTRAVPAFADEASCDACCNNNYSFCTTYWNYACAQPAIAACERAGGDPGTCSFEVYYGTCYPEFNGCSIEQENCAAGCQANVNYCS